MTQPSASDDSLRQGISVTRAFAAPRDRVWREWTDPEAFADWFGGSGGEASFFDRIDDRLEPT